MKKILLILALGIFLFSFVSAQDEVFLKNDPVDLKITCLKSSGFCASTATCNASITYPNNTYVASNILFQNQIFVHNHTINSSITGTIGEYTVRGFCRDGGFTEEIDFNFKVTGSGDVLTTGESIIYLVLAAFSFAMFIGMAWFGIGLPFTNPKNSFNELIGINKLKYAKLGASFLAFAFFTWLVNLLFILSSSLVSLTQFSGFFKMLFEISLALVWPLFVVMFVAFFIIGARDLKLMDLLQRGINP